MHLELPCHVNSYMTVNMTLTCILSKRKRVERV